MDANRGIVDAQRSTGLTHQQRLGDEHVDAAGIHEIDLFHIDEDAVTGVELVEDDLEGQHRVGIDIASQ